MPTVAGTTAMELLLSLSFGDGVAEFEPTLARHFLRTSAFQKVVRDEVDLVRGVKGSGKSAIFRFLQTSSASPHLADVIVIPAFDFLGDDLFHQIIREWSNASEEILRKRWRVYVLAVVGNSLCDRFAGDSRLDELATYLELMGLRSRERRFSRLMKVFKSAAVVWDEPDDQSRENAAEDMFELASVTRSTLKTLRRRVWVVFDRLDEAFYTDPAAERVALRALVQVTRDMNAIEHGHNEIRLKLFLRDDILLRMARGGPQTNLTHVRKLKLSWTRDALAEMLVRRVLDSDEMARAFKLKRNDARSKEGRHRILCALMPKHTPTPLPSRDHEYCRLTWSWMMMYLRDGTNEVNPRNLISFLEIARGEQQDIWVQNDPPPRVEYLLSGLALYRAWIKLSSTRLEDSVLLEHAGLEQFVNRLRGGPLRYWRDELEVRLECGPGGPSIEDASHRLTSAGVLRDMEDGTYQVPLLYRPALRMDAQVWTPADPMSGG